MPTTATVTVEQRHEEAAAAFIRSDDCPLGAKFMLGGLPYKALTQAFARFDTTRTAELERENAALREALRAVEPYLDAIVCYASTIDEHDGNRVAALVRNALGGQP